MEHLHISVVLTFLSPPAERSLRHNHVTAVRIWAAYPRLRFASYRQQYQWPQTLTCRLPHLLAKTFFSLNLSNAIAWKGQRLRVLCLRWSVPPLTSRLAGDFSFSLSHNQICILTHSSVSKPTSLLTAQPPLDGYDNPFFFFKKNSMYVMAQYVSTNAVCEPVRTYLCPWVWWMICDKCVESALWLGPTGTGRCPCLFIFYSISFYSSSSSPWPPPSPQAHVDRLAVWLWDGVKCPPPPPITLTWAPCLLLLKNQIKKLKTVLLALLNEDKCWSKDCLNVSMKETKPRKRAQRAFGCGGGI